MTRKTLTLLTKLIGFIDVPAKKFKKEEQPTDWKKFKKEKKLLKEKRKQRDAKEGKETYILSVKAKAIWEELRNSKCSESEKESLSKQLMDLIQGNIKKVSNERETLLDNYSDRYLIL